MTEKEIAMTVQTIFVNFVSRDGTLTREQATEEFARLQNKTLDQYLTTCRIGGTFRLDRAARRSLYLTYENAQNHAGFEAFLKKDACPRCSGAGKLDAYRHVDNGVCFKCGGSGKNA
jgi:DnaJ-class molecular chaperone